MRVASAATTSMLSTPAVTSRSAGINARSNSIARTPRSGRRERQRERAQPGADLDDAIARAGTRLGGDRPREVRVDQEVLTERLGRLDAVARRQLADGAGPEAAPPLAARVATS